jgi:hypothetical protein
MASHSDESRLAEPNSIGRFLRGSFPDFVESRTRRSLKGHETELNQNTPSVRPRWLTGQGEHSSSRTARGILRLSLFRGSVCRS